MKRAVTVILDGLRADRAFGLDLPNIDRLRSAVTSFTALRAIFPSATRASSASVATGCWPARHRCDLGILPDLVADCLVDRLPDPLCIRLRRLLWAQPNLEDWATLRA